MPRFFLTLAVTTTLLGSLAALPAPCAAGEPAGAAERETARRLMDEGRERMNANDPAGALPSFLKAHAIMHVPTTGLALARARLALNHLVEARDVVREVLRMPVAEDEPEAFGVARDRVREIDESLKGKIPSLRISVKGGTPARIAIDGMPMNVALLEAPAAANPGEHTVVVQGPDGGERSAAVTLAEGETKDVAIDLTAEPSGRTDTPVRGPGLPIFESRTPLARGLMIGGLGVAAAGVVVGSVTGVISLSSASNVKSECTGNLCDESVRDDLDSARTFATISNVAFIVGGAGLATAIVGWVLPRQRHTVTGGRASMMPMLGAGSVGLWGAF
jgi:hypothetical protein